MFSCRMVGFWTVLTMYPKKGRFDPHASHHPETNVLVISRLKLKMEWVGIFPFLQTLFWSGMQTATINLVTT